MSHKCDKCQCLNSPWLWMNGSGWYCESCYTEMGGSVLIEMDKQEEQSNE